MPIFSRIFATVGSYVGSATTSLASYILPLLVDNKENEEEARESDSQELIAILQQLSYTEAYGKQQFTDLQEGETAETRMATRNIFKTQMAAKISEFNLNEAQANVIFSILTSGDYTKLLSNLKELHIPEDFILAIKTLLIGTKKLHPELRDGLLGEITRADTKITELKSVEAQLEEARAEILALKRQLEQKSSPSSPGPTIEESAVMPSSSPDLSPLPPPPPPPPPSMPRSPLATKSSSPVTLAGALQRGTRLKHAVQESRELPKTPMDRIKEELQHRAASSSQKAPLDIDAMLAKTRAERQSALAHVDIYPARKAAGGPPPCLRNTS